MFSSVFEKMGQGDCKLSGQQNLLEAFSLQEVLVNAGGRNFTGT